MTNQKAVKWGSFSRWSFGPNPEKMHPTLCHINYVIKANLDITSGFRFINFLFRFGFFFGFGVGFRWILSFSNKIKKFWIYF